MKTMSRILAKDIEISNSCDDLEWMDVQELAREIIDDLPSRYRLMLIEATNVDWLHHSGYSLTPIPKYEELWSKIAGWDRADWTLRFDVIKQRRMQGKAYSHDTPTGGDRLVRFLDGKGIYNRLLKSGWTYPKLVKVLAQYGWGSGGQWNRERIYNHFENIMPVEDVISLF